jgi:nitrogen fixation NifU-like protein
MSRKLSEEELVLMAESGYSPKAIEYCSNSVNVGVLERPCLSSTFRGPCGDLIKLYLKISESEVIEDAKYSYLGCPGSAASASAMTTLLKGITISQAKKLTEKDILENLGGLPEHKRDCATLSVKTLRKAVAEYEKLKGQSEI